MKDSDSFAHCVSGYLCITIGGSDCAAERLPPHSSFIAGHNELIQVGNFFFFQKLDEWCDVVKLLGGKS